MHTVFYNHKIVSADEVLITSSNRSFKYGDGLFETITVLGQRPLFIDLHVNRLLKGSYALEINIPETYTGTFLRDTITGLCKINKIQNARCRITLWRNGGGFYTPDQNDASLLIEVSEREEEIYTLNETGLHLGVFSKLSKTPNSIAPYKTANSLIYVLAAKFAHEQNFQDVVVLNDAGRVADAISSNVFIWKENKLITPPIKEGGVVGVMREVVMFLCKKEGIQFTENELTLEALKDADEIFLTNVVHGLKWVKTFQQKNYEHTFSRRILHIINEAIHNNTLVSS